MSPVSTITTHKPLTYFAFTPAYRYNRVFSLCNQSMEESNSREPKVTLTLESTHITILGTAHVSQTSADAVKTLIHSGDFDHVAIELCDSRFSNLTDPDKLAKMDLFKVIKEGKAPMVMASLALGAFQQRLADQFGIKPGAEMLAAIKEAKQRDIPLKVIDRDIGITLKRVYRAVPWWQRTGIFSGLIASAISREKIEEEDIERLKEGDMLESTFSEFAENSKNLYGPLIDERDRYMADQIYQIQKQDHPKHLLVIIGAGHLKGIESYLKELDANQPSLEEVNKDLQELSKTPVKSWLWKIIPWAIVGIILLGFGLGFSRSSELGWELVRDWVLINGGLAALGALLATAHPVTTISAFLAAPLTSLNPTIGAGMVTGGVELMMRRPQVEDFSALRKDTAHWQGWWKNRVSKVLLVFFFCTLGSAIGTYVAGFKIIDKLF